MIASSQDRLAVSPPGLLHPVHQPTWVVSTHDSDLGRFTATGGLILQHDASVATPRVSMVSPATVSLEPCGESAETAPHVVVVMPAYNAAMTLERTFRDIPGESVDAVILVDDGSHDQTVRIAGELGIAVIVHPHNVGYGGNQKTCYMEALRRGADAVVMLHPDGQYDPRALTDLVREVRAGANVVLASRMLMPGGAAAGGMPLWKRVANRFLTSVENRTLGLHLSEYHTGYRAYSRHFLETVPFLRNSNDFVFDQEILVQAAHFGFEIVEIPIETRYFPEASSVAFNAGVVYGIKTLALLCRYRLHRAGMRSRLFTR